MKTFKLLPLSLAVGGLCAMSAHAESMENKQPHVELAAEVVNVDRQGAKIKNNIVTTDDKDARTETDLRGLLKDEPAIDFAGGNGTSQFVTIRGMGQNSIDVKVDDAYSDSQILYHQGRFMLDPSLVKIVSVQKGAGSASAGIGATNGAIVARTVDAADLLRGSDKDWGVKVNAGYSDNDEHSYGVSAFAQNDQFDVLISGNQVKQENYKAGEGYQSTVTGSNEVPYSALDKTSYLAKAGVNLGDHRFVLSHYKDENKGVRNIREEFDYFDNGPSTQDPQYRKASVENTNLEWTGNNLGFVDIVKANVYQMKNTRQSDDDARNNYAGAFGGTNETSVTTTGANLNLDSMPADGVTLKYGVNFRHQEVNPNKLLKATDRIGRDKVLLGADVVNQEKTDIGAYVEAIGEIGPVTATAGVRYDAWQFDAMDGKRRKDDDLNPSLGLIWQATPNLSLSANHNYATRSPRLYDALMAHGGRGIVSIASDAKAEKAQNTEVGFNYNHALNNGDSVIIDGGYYWQNIDNLLNSATATRHNVASYSEIQNAGRLKNEGYELGAAYRSKNLSARVGVSESNPKIYSDLNADGTPVARFSNREYAMPIGRTWTADAAYRIAPANLEIGARVRHVEKAAGQSAWQHHLMTGVPQTQNDLDLVRDGYTVGDVYANWQPYGNNVMNVNLAVNNVTDELYRPHSGSITHLPAPGREFRVGVNYNF